MVNTGAGLMGGLDDVRGLFQTKQFYEPVTRVTET